MATIIVSVCETCGDMKLNADQRSCTRIVERTEKCPGVMRRVNNISLLRCDSCSHELTVILPENGSMAIVGEPRLHKGDLLPDGWRTKVARNPLTGQIHSWRSGKGTAMFQEAHEQLDALEGNPCPQTTRYKGPCGGPIVQYKLAAERVQHANHR